MSNEVKNNQDQEFEQMMEERIRQNFNAPAQAGASATDERLKEMNKKLLSTTLRLWEMKITFILNLVVKPLLHV